MLMCTDIMKTVMEESSIDAQDSRFRAQGVVDPSITLCAGLPRISLLSVLIPQAKTLAILRVSWDRRMFENLGLPLQVVTRSCRDRAPNGIYG